MKKLILLISIIFITSCSKNRKTEKYSDYIYNTLGVKSVKDKNEYFIILNPNSRCTACYLGAINSVVKSSNKYDITIITNYDISRYIEDTTITKIIDDDKNIIKSNPKESFNSKFLKFRNQELIFDRTISTVNTDSILYYVN